MGCVPATARSADQGITTQAPNRVLIDHDLWVVLDVDTPTYFAEGAYWSFGRGRWYRAAEWYDAFEPQAPDAVPERLVDQPRWQHVRLVARFQGPATEQPRPGFPSDGTRVATAFMPPTAPTLGGAAPR